MNKHANVHFQPQDQSQEQEQNQEQQEIEESDCADKTNENERHEQDEEENKVWSYVSTSYNIVLPTKIDLHSNIDIESLGHSAFMIR